ncbi:sigma-70 family RNA polymerase sigma factor [Aurantimonas sp. VKM B-3413]|uniref:sigma-70 family RNA polymerase sigma factor n=1 Tax=Aurantimonas sp. VKM B-3413 TaxID=2779401 RepID=UPI001E2B6978|nr:sigma-70 family RNA polymerase sigma factor [Aurantimonas sp. VKM B-3413]MCB8836204.1 sigma-70 family RNA polymerase sigma factor [Aurantimonas sp. VKM B-3413]
MEPAFKTKRQPLEELLASAVAGDDRAYREFLIEASAVLRRFVARRVPRNAVAFDVEDLVQEILMAVHRKRHTWRTDEPVGPWLFAIARYKTIDAYRRRGQRVDVDIADFADLLEDPSTVPTATAHDVNRALGTLAGKQRAVVSALSVEGRSIGETAERFGMSEGAVRVAFHRGLAALAKKFGQN